MTQSLVPPRGCMKIEFSIDGTPPSVNHCYYHRICGYGAKKYVKKGYTKRAKDFMELVRYALLGASPCPTGRLGLDISVRFKDKRKRDLDNVLKVLLDSLEFYVGDDSRFDRIVIQREPHGAERMKISIERIVTI